MKRNPPKKEEVAGEEEEENGNGACLDGTMAPHYSFIVPSETATETKSFHKHPALIPAVI